MGAETICKQLGYEKGVKGPRYTNQGGSGPFHVVRRGKHALETCKHTIDQSVKCSGGLGPQIGTTTATAPIIGR